MARAFRSRNFRLFFGGQSVSLVGTWITRIATSWLVYRLTGSALLLGVVGALGGALYLASRRSVLGLGRVMALATANFGLGLIAFSLTRTLWFALATLPFVGAGMMVTMAATNTIIQTVVTEELRGRVMAFYTTAFLGTAPIGS